MTKVQEHLDLLGHRVKDRVSGATGIVASISFDLYGCIQAIVDRGIGADGKKLEPGWFDVIRLKRISTEPVMERPDYVEGKIAEGKHGPAEKPESRF